jgi:hypothetical protein
MFRIIDIKICHLASGKFIIITKLQINLNTQYQTAE